jgi:hypothetical protein
VTAPTFNAAMCWPRRPWKLATIPRVSTCWPFDYTTSSPELFNVTPSSELSGEGIARVVLAHGTFTDSRLKRRWRRAEPGPDADHGQSLSDHLRCRPYSRNAELHASGGFRSP